jgi:uncharacterized membrane protein
MRPNQILAAAALTAAAAASATLAGPPQYMIIDIGIVQSGQTASQGLRISPGGVGVGRALGNPSQAFSWTLGGGIVGLPNLASRPFAAANGANDMGAVVGTGTTTAFGSSPLPIIWQNGIATELALPAGQTFGRANDINNNFVAVGSVNGGSAERAAIYSNGSASVITATTSGGSFMTTAFGINDAGLAVGNGVDPNNAARNVGIAYDTVTGVATDIGALAGRNGALAFDVSEAGHVVGSSMLNQGAGTPFIWTANGGMVEVGLPTGASQGSARGVNSNGWVVGTASSAFALPFLFDGNQTYLLQDLLVNPDGWDISMNTSSSALGISENGTIIGTGVFNGQVHAYAAVLVPAPGVVAALAPAGILAFRRRR